MVIVKLIKIEIEDDMCEVWDSNPPMRCQVINGRPAKKRNARWISMPNWASPPLPRYNNSGTQQILGQHK